MQIKSFEIENFKGIESCKLELSLNEAGNITTLIGLNESGKTTILEALANFIGEDRALLAVIGTHRPLHQLRDYIPKHRRANFTDSIILTASVSLEDEDKDALAKFYLDKHGLILDRDGLPPAFDIQRKYVYENSEHKSSGNHWGLKIFLKKKGQRVFREYRGGGETYSVWLDGAKFISDQLLPRVCYFPTFLFEIPQRVLLSDDDTSETGVYYRRLLQNVLDARGDGLDLKVHVMDRLAKFREKDGSTGQVSWNAVDRNTKENVSAVFTRLSSEMNRTIIGAWDKIFGASPSGKKIIVDWDFDAKTNVPYCEFKVQDAEDLFFLSERSLGFRWFFCFLLLTQFNTRKGERQRTYFLLDEPASHLHSSAQLSLLKSFPKIVGTRNAIVYSTHSHYMVEPLWLEGAYIVANYAVDYDEDSADFDYTASAATTKIFATKYRAFVAQHPDTPTYFQPVLDRLDYQASPLIGARAALIFEGKQDFYAAKYFLPGLGLSDVDILPGAGAGNMRVLISLFIGWGRKFLILLDDDKEGRLQRRKYKIEEFIADHNIATLGDVSPSLKGRELEDLFSAKFKNLVSKERSLKRSPRKKDYAFFFQERLADGRPRDFSDIDAETLEAMRKIAVFANRKLC